MGKRQKIDVILDIPEQSWVTSSFCDFSRVLLREPASPLFSIDRMVSAPPTAVVIHDNRWKYGLLLLMTERPEEPL